MPRNSTSEKDDLDYANTSANKFVVPLLDTSIFSAESAVEICRSNSPPAKAEKLKNKARDFTTTTSYLSLMQNTKISALDNCSTDYTGKNSTFADQILKLGNTPGIDAFSSQRDEIRRGLHAMKSRIDQLEDEKQRAEGKFQQLQRGLEKYADLIGRNVEVKQTGRKHTVSSEKNKPPDRRENRNHSTDNSSTDEGLFNDAGINEIYDNLQRRLLALEAASKENEPRLRVASSSSSAPEIDRAAAFSAPRPTFKMPFEPHVDDRSKSVEKGGAGQRSSDNYEPARGRVRQEEVTEARPPSCNKSVDSTLSRVSLNLTTNQREKLTELAEKIKSGSFLTPPVARSPPKHPSSTKGHNRSVQVNAVWPSVVDRSAQNGDSLLAGSRELVDGRLDYDKLRWKLRELKEKAGKAAERLSRDEKQEYDALLGRRDSGGQGGSNVPPSGPCSPARKIVKRDAIVCHGQDAFLHSNAKPAFVAATSSTATVSHSLVANVQELLSILKRQNPALHQTALKMLQDQGWTALSSADVLARTFEKELRAIKRGAEKELRAMLKFYDEMCASKEPRTEQFAKQQNSLVAEMELKDTYIQKLNSQLSWLRSMAPTGHDPRQCRKLGPANNGGSQHHRGGHVTRHTVASRLRVTRPISSVGRSAAKHRAAHFARLLNEVRAAKHLIDNGTPPV